MSENKEANILPAEDVVDFDIWTPPEVIGRSVNSDQIDARNAMRRSLVSKTSITAQNAQQISETAYLEGLTKGRADAKLEQQQITNNLNAILEQCHQQSVNFEQHICEQLVSMTITIAKHVIHHELSVNPDLIMTIIQDAIGYLPASSEKIMIKLHPDDAVLVREAYHLDQDPDRSWKIMEDPGMQRGGCIINSDTSMVNADLDNRIANIISQLTDGSTADE